MATLFRIIFDFVRERLESEQMNPSLKSQSTLPFPKSIEEAPSAPRQSPSFIKYELVSLELSTVIRYLDVSLDWLIQLHEIRREMTRAEYFIG